MQTLPVPAKNVKAFYATGYDAPVRIVKVDGVIYVVTDDDVEPFEVEMAPFTCVLGEVGLSDTQALMESPARWGSLDRHAPQPRGRLTMAAITFSEALEQAEVLARQALPPESHERLSCAVALVRQGSVFQDDSGHWTVASTSTPDKRYSINGSCSCEDAFYRAPEGRCKHKLAQYLARKVLALMTVAQTGSPEPTPEVFVAGNNTQPLFEAPSSANCHLMIAGHQVQLTLSDHDEGRLLERLQAVLAQYPVPQASQAPAPTQGQGKEWCHLHIVKMKWNEGLQGRKGWHSHRLADGQWCQGR
jgi:hypothetical protein